MAGIKDYDDICVTLEDGSVRRCILSHYFIPMYNGHRHQAIHLHGHSHTTDEADLEFQIAQMLNYKGFANDVFNVGCMYWNYEPITLDEILKSNSQPRYETIEMEIDAELYAQVKEILKPYGMTPEEAVVLMFKETVRLGKIPFDYTEENLQEAKKLSRKDATDE